MEIGRTFRQYIGVLFAGIALMSVPVLTQAAQNLSFVEGAPPSVSMADLAVATAAKFLDAEGLSVATNFAPNGAVATQLVSVGQSDIGDVTMEPYLTGFEKGMRGKFIGVRGNLNIYFLAIPADSPIQSMKDLAGKKIGVLNMASQSIPYIKAMARSAGLDPNADMFLPVGVGDSAMAALRSGQVQALALNRIFYAGLVRGGASFRYVFGPSFADAGNYGYFVADSTLASKRPALVGFMRAMIKADIFIRENPAAALSIYWKQYPSAKPAGSEQDALRLGTLELTFNPTNSAAALRPERVSAPEADALKRLIAAMRAEGMFKADLSVADLVDDSVFKEAQKGVDVAAVRKLAREWK